ncbi:hypothetical protein GCM10023194_56740 [Planotetraspora phitsanulokensis]|uniref:STAS domain-containing protein n=1 Tax=Planotetraspora phitsanulokensis TaxID=575192 RepID=A0A8J3UEI2_9ACTN|nr:STAS domain-containing protein [Planotetraspora phitsanulokensis]GII43031.1 hypothetical protein Pph01_80340 [Planotetraspora phitsanulokensis]
MTVIRKSVTPGARKAGDPVEAVLYLDQHLRVTCNLGLRTTLIQLIGELDASNAQALARTLTQVGRGEDTLVIDTAQLDFIDLAGLRMLTGLCRDDSVLLINVPRHMLRLIELLAGDTDGPQETVNRGQEATTDVRTESSAVRPLPRAG